MAITYTANLKDQPFYVGIQRLEKVRPCNTSGPDCLMSGHDCLISGFERLMSGPDCLISGPDCLMWAESGSDCLMCAESCDLHGQLERPAVIRRHQTPRKGASVDRLRVSGRGTARTEDAEGTPTQSHISSSMLVNEQYLTLLCVPNSLYLVLTVLSVPNLVRTVLCVPKSLDSGVRPSH